MAGAKQREYVGAVVGATGAVGEVLLCVLEERRFPVGELRPLASERSVGSRVRFRDQELAVESIRQAKLSRWRLRLSG